MYLILAFVAFILSVCFLRAYFLFNDKDFNTVTLTSYGFAIFVGVATVCFNWARSFDTSKHRQIIQFINNTAELSIYGCVFFLITSVAKYFAYNPVKKYPYVDETTEAILKYGSMPFLWFAFIIILFNILRIITIGSQLIIIGPDKLEKKLKNELPKVEAEECDSTEE